MVLQISEFCFSLHEFILWVLLIRKFSRGFTVLQNDGPTSWTTFYYKLNSLVKHSKGTMEKMVFMILVSVFWIHQGGGYSMSDLKRLKMELLNETIYDKSVRPSLNQSKSIEVSLASII